MCFRDSRVALHACVHLYLTILEMQRMGMNVYIAKLVIMEIQPRCTELKVLVSNMIYDS